MCVWDVLIFTFYVFYFIYDKHQLTYKNTINMCISLSVLLVMKHLPAAFGSLPNTHAMDHVACCPWKTKAEEGVLNPSLI